MMQLRNKSIDVMQLDIILARAVSHKKEGLRVWRQMEIIPPGNNVPVTRLALGRAPI